MIITEVDALTGEATERPATAKEKAQWAADADVRAAAELQAEARVKAAASARKKIAEASCLTPDEVAALGL